MPRGPGSHRGRPQRGARPPAGGSADWSARQTSRSGSHTARARSCRTVPSAVGRRQPWPPAGHCNRVEAIGRGVERIRPPDSPIAVALRLEASARRSRPRRREAATARGDEVARAQSAAPLRSRGAGQGRPSGPRRDAGHRACAPPGDRTVLVLVQLLRERLDSTQGADARCRGRQISPRLGPASASADAEARAVSLAAWASLRASGELQARDARLRSLRSRPARRGGVAARAPRRAAVPPRRAGAAAVSASAARAASARRIAAASSPRPSTRSATWPARPGPRQLAVGRADGGLEIQVALGTGAAIAASLARGSASAAARSSASRARSRSIASSLEASRPSRSWSPVSAGPRRLVRFAPLPFRRRPRRTARRPGRRWPRPPRVGHRPVAPRSRPSAPLAVAAASRAAASCQRAWVEASSAATSSSAIVERVVCCSAWAASRRACGRSSADVVDPGEVRLRLASCSSALRRRRSWRRTPATSSNSGRRSSGRRAPGPGRPCPGR